MWNIRCKRQSQKVHTRPLKHDTAYNAKFILVMQCFRVGYRGICHASLVFSVCGNEENTSDKWCVSRYPTKKHCITTFMPKSSENLRKFLKELEISGHFRKLRKRFKPVFEERKRLMKILENLWKSLEIFEKLRKRSKMVLKFSENLRKSSEFSENSGNGSKTFFR